MAKVRLSPRNLQELQAMVSPAGAIPVDSFDIGNRVAELLSMISSEGHSIDDDVMKSIVKVILPAAGIETRERGRAAAAVNKMNQLGFSANLQERILATRNEFALEKQQAAFGQRAESQESRQAHARGTQDANLEAREQSQTSRQAHALAKQQIALAAQEQTQASKERGRESKQAFDLERDQTRLTAQQERALLVANQRATELGIKTEASAEGILAKGEQARQTLRESAELKEHSLDRKQERIDTGVRQVAAEQNKQLQTLQAQAAKITGSRIVRSNDPVIKALAENAAKLDKTGQGVVAASAMLAAHENKVAASKHQTAAFIAEAFTAEGIPVDEAFVEKVANRTVETGRKVPNREIQAKIRAVKDARALEAGNTRLRLATEGRPGGEGVLSKLRGGGITDLPTLASAEKNLPGLLKAAGTKSKLMKGGVAAGLGALILPALFRSIRGDDQPKGSQLSPEMQMLMMQQLQQQQGQGGGASGRDMLNLTRSLSAIKSLQELMGMQNEPVARGVV